MVSWEALRADFRKRTRAPGVRMGVAVLESDTDSFLGWAAVDPSRNEIIYAYTSSPYRTRDRFEPRIASTLVAAMGVDLTRDTTLTYWSPAAQTIASRPGYHLQPTTKTK